MRNRLVVLGFIAASGAFLVGGRVSAGDGATPAEIADLVDELRDADAHVREVARRELVALGDQAVGPLVALLGGDEPRGRAEAVSVLAALGPVARDAAPALAARLELEKGAARLPFLKALAEIDPAGSVQKAAPILLAFLDDKDSAVRLEAAAALRSYGPAASRFAPDVLRRIPDADPALRLSLLETMRLMGVDAGACVVDLYVSSGDTSSSWLPAVVNELGEAVVPAATQRLSSEDKNVRAAAAEVLAAAGSGARSAAPQLVAALNDPAGVVRRRAAEALGAIGADARIAMPGLLALLDDASARAQVEAAAAIGRVAVVSARPNEDPSPATGTVGRAIDDGLDWLARHQFGGDVNLWSAAGFQNLCPKDAKCGGPGEEVNSLGVTALATLAFLGAGETHQSGEHKANVMRAVQYMRLLQDADGCSGPRAMKHWVYFHGLCTLALVEDYRLTQSPVIKAPARKGLEFIRRAQNPYLAWRYSFPPDGDNDTSVTGWMMRALAAGKRAGFDSDPAAARGALAWVDKMTDPETGRTGYQQRGGPPARTNEMLDRFPPEKSESLTAEALCIRLDAGQDPNSDLVRKSAALVAQRQPTWSPDGGVDLYYWFHGTDAMRRIGGSAWETWRNSLVAALVPHQQRSSAGCARGSWDPDDPWGGIGGRVYSTSMAILGLEMCGVPEKKATPTAEVRAAIAALTKALETEDDVLRQAAQAALDDIHAAYR